MNIILLKIANDEVPLATERDNRIYVSGPMTGLPNYNFDAFNEASAKLKELGWLVSNPADHGLVDGATREDYLRYDAAQLVSCSTVFLLPDWDKSDGARWEVSIAQKLGMVLINEYKNPDAVQQQDNNKLAVRSAEPASSYFRGQPTALGGRVGVFSKRTRHFDLEDQLSRVSTDVALVKDRDYLTIWTEK